jgi:hypothetical protein
MTNAKALLIVGLASMVIFASTAFGGAPMGPPMALLGEGNWGFGGEYGHENMNLRASGTFRAMYPDVPFDFVETVQIDDLAMNMFFGTLAYGVCDNWDIFVRAGAADAKDEARATANIPRISFDFNDVDLIDQLGVRQRYPLGGIDSDYGFAWGVGTRATFCRSGPWAFGGLVQATWFKPGDSDIRYADPLFPIPPGVEHVGDAELDFWETQVSLAVSYQVDTWRLWVGPFLQYVVGDFDRSGRILVDGADLGDTFRASSDLQQESEIGGHFGADWSISEQLDLWVEGQLTGDSWFGGIGLIIKPQETFGM